MPSPLRPPVNNFQRSVSCVNKLHRPKPLAERERGGVAPAGGAGAGVWAGRPGRWGARAGGRRPARARGCGTERWGGRDGARPSGASSGWGRATGSRGGFSWGGRPLGVGGLPSWGLAGLYCTCSSSPRRRWQGPGALMCGPSPAFVPAARTRALPPPHLSLVLLPPFCLGC